MEDSLFPPEHSDQIRQLPDGSYEWNCSVDKEYERRIYKVTMITITITCVFILVFGLIMSAAHHAWDTMVWVLIPAFVVWGLSALLCWGLDRITDDPHETFYMTDTYVKTGSGRSSEYFGFKSTKHVIRSPKYIELQASVRKIRVYFPEEDREFVRDYILRRVPDEVGMTYL